MDNLDYCFHTHTARCGHAFGADREYVEHAIDDGYRRLGFSDHAILPFLSQPGMRGDYSELDDYISSVGLLRAEFASKIKIFLAFEAEWYGERRNDYYEWLYREKGFDYFILGHHLSFNGERPRWFASLGERAFPLYAREVIEGIESGYFLYLAHPDLYMSWNPLQAWDRTAIEAARKIIEAAVRHDLPLEVNLGYTRWTRPYSIDGELSYAYPCSPFWKLARELGAKCVIGVDAHSPFDLKENTNLAYALSFVNRHGLEVLSGDEIEKRIALLKEKWGR